MPSSSSFITSVNAAGHGASGRARDDSEGRDALLSHRNPAAADGSDDFVETPPLPRGCLMCTALNAFLMLIAGLLLLLVAPPLLRDYIESILPISNPTSVIFDMWQDTKSSSVLTRSFYFFNLTNAEDVYNFHAVPDYHRIGPFVYRERTYNPMESIFWLPNTSISYKYKTELYFAPELSVDENGNKLDPMTTRIVNVNIPLFAAAYRLSRFPDVEFNITLDIFGQHNITVGKKAACLVIDAMVEGTIISPTGIFSNRTVNELLFGYKDDIWTAFSLMGDLMDYKAPTVFRAFWNVSQPSPSPYTFRSGQMCPMWDDQDICNSSASTPSLAYSGADWHTANNVYSGGGRNMIGSITQWAGQTKLHWWPNTTTGSCQTIKGGNGMFYPMGIDKSAKPYVYIDELFRDVQLEFERETEVKGIKTLRYRIAESEIEQFNENAECFDQNFLGIMNLSRPTFGPLFASLPFFERTQPVQVPRGESAPKTLLNFTVDGVPIGDFQQKHKGQFETYVDVLPVTGTLLEGSANLQSATILGPITINDCPWIFPQLQPRTIRIPTGTDANGNTTYREVHNSSFPETMVPVFYLDRHAVITDDLATRIKNTVILPFLICYICGAIFCGICPIVLLVGALWIRRDRKRRMTAVKAALDHLHHQVEDEDGGPIVGSGGGTYGGVPNAAPSSAPPVGNGYSVPSSGKQTPSRRSLPPREENGGTTLDGHNFHHQHHAAHSEAELIARHMMHPPPEEA